MSHLTGAPSPIPLIPRLCLAVLFTACAPTTDPAEGDPDGLTDTASDDGWMVGDVLSAGLLPFLGASDTGELDTGLPGTPDPDDTGIDTDTDTAIDTDPDTAIDTDPDTAIDTDTAVDTDPDTDTAIDTDPDTDPDTAIDTDSGSGCLAGTPAPSFPDLLTAASFAVLGGSTVTSSGATVLAGDLGVSPGSAIVGFPPGIVTGSTHANDATAIQAQIDATAAYTDAAGRSGATSLPEDISGLTLVPGVYVVSASLQLASADLTLDGGGDPNATWIFQIGSTLTTASGVDVVLTGCADAANVFWQVGTSATIGSGTDLVGTIVADQSITVVTGANVDGRLLARGGAVTLDTNAVTVP